ncbi:DUF6622 family protein [Paraburkholderia phymatum]|uniref:Transmembrane protein n=1 Tax=Paraburkholderia phymatum (strain DSM 17167 / CIP 108236 / LMG 21445 / STM815) TaxID=391038 RepID=B2JUQ3_PARP8|nr:DUF6622 family protein [Paraburkholderia phymatum]ACC76224.1 conserved hypothetical protein [Paraburkholderia phymatum STM815]
MPLAAIIQGTPIWVWVLLVFLLSRGFKAMNSGTAPLSKLAIVPLVFTAWGILHLIADPLAGWSSVIVWVVCALAGIAGGVFIAKRTRFIVDPVANTVMLPGSVLPLVLIVFTFAARFWLGVQLATATSLSSLGICVLLSAAVSGVVAGVFGGRFLTYWKAMSARRVVQACSQGA